MSSSRSPSRPIRSSLSSLKIWNGGGLGGAGFLEVHDEAEVSEQGVDDVAGSLTGSHFVESAVARLFQGAAAAAAGAGRARCAAWPAGLRLLLVLGQPLGKDLHERRLAAPPGPPFLAAPPPAGPDPMSPQRPFDQFGLGHPLHHPRLEDADDVRDRPVECQRGREVVAQEKEENGIIMKMRCCACMFGSGLFGVMRHLDEHGSGHDQRERIDREAPQMELGVRHGEVSDPPEPMPTQFDGVSEHRVEAEENRDLQEHREAAADRIDARISCTGPSPGHSSSAGRPCT